MQSMWKAAGAKRREGSILVSSYYAAPRALFAAAEGVAGWLVGYFVGRVADSNEAYVLSLILLERRAHQSYSGAAEIGQWSRQLRTAKGLPKVKLRVWSARCQLQSRVIRKNQLRLGWMCILLLAILKLMFQHYENKKQ